MAEPLVLICGIASDEDSWAAVAARLCGIASPVIRIAQGDGMEAMAADIVAQAPPRFALAGHSMGGYVALAVQAAVPDRVSRLALVNASAAADTAAQAHGRTRLIEEVEAQGYRAVATRLAPMLVHPDTERDAARFMPIAAMVARAQGDRFIREQRATMGRPDHRAALPAIAVPVLAIAGQADRIVDPQASAVIARLVPDGKFVILADCGHVATMEQPKAVAHHMRDWLLA